MRHPLLVAVAAGVLVVLLAVAMPMWHLLVEGPAAPQRDLPWQAQAQADGSLQVFGLALGRDTLADVRQRFGDGLQVALVARLDEPGALEALADPFAAGVVTGRLVLAFDAPRSALQRWRDGATRSEPMEGGARRFSLRVADQAESLRAPLIGVSFVPVARLSEADVRQRFGPPAATLAMPADATALLFPERGLAVTVAGGADGARRRSVLQYVAPRDFDARLRAPLLRALSAEPVAEPAPH